MLFHFSQIFALLRHFYHWDPNSMVTHAEEPCLMGNQISLSSYQYILSHSPACSPCWHLSLLKTIICLWICKCILLVQTYNGERWNVHMRICTYTHTHVSLDWLLWCVHTFLLQTWKHCWPCLGWLDPGLCLSCFHVSEGDEEVARCMRRVPVLMTFCLVTVKSF